MKNITQQNSTLLTIGNFISGDFFKSNDQKIFNNFSKISIPLYQRDYSWNEESMNNFLYAIEEFLIDPIATRPLYFGNIFYYVNSNNNDMIDIVDGQQRITTFYILLLACRNFLQSQEYQNKNKNENIDDIKTNINKFLISNEDDSQKINHSNQRERTLFTELIDYSKETYCSNNNVDINKKNTNLFIKNYNLISQWLMNKTSEYINLVSSIVKIIEKKIIVGIFCLDDMEEAIITFSTINSRGQNLTILDLLKSEIYSVADKNNKIQEFDDEWQNFLNLLNHEDSIYKKDYDKFLQHYLFSRFKYAKKTELKKIKTEWLDKKQSSIWIIKDMALYMSSFLKIFSENSILSTEAKLLELQQHIPVSINIYEKYKKSLDWELIIQKIHELLFSKICINNEQANVFEKIMQELSIEMRKTDSNLIGLLNKYFDDAMGNQEREDFINKLIVIDVKKSGYIKFIFSKTMLGYEQNIDWRKSTLEHICPKNLTAWKKERPEYSFENLIYKIGNGTILESKLNTSISNQTFLNKKQYIEKLNSEEANPKSKDKKTNLVYNKVVEENFFKEKNLFEQNEWTKEIVDSRSEKICKSLLEKDFMGKIS